MERNKRTPSRLDQLIGDSLRDNLGPPPSREVWHRIAGEISQSPPRRVPNWRLSFLRAPLVQSAFVLALLVIVIGQPAYHELSREFSHDSATVPARLPYTTTIRPVPAADLAPPAEEAPDREVTKLREERLPLAKLYTVEAP